MHHNHICVVLSRKLTSVVGNLVVSLVAEKNESVDLCVNESTYAIKLWLRMIKLNLGRVGRNIIANIWARDHEIVSTSIVRYLVVILDAQS